MAADECQAVGLSGHDALLPQLPEVPCGSSSQAATRNSRRWRATGALAILAATQMSIHNVIALSLAGVLLGGCSQGSVDNRIDGLMLDASSVGMVDSDDGVHIFTHAPQNWNDALYVGAPSIDDTSCLRIGEYVVVWHVDLLDEAKGLAASAMTNEASEVSLGGSVAPASDRVEEACGVGEVWSGSPDFFYGSILPED